MKSVGSLYTSLLASSCIDENTEKKRISNDRLDRSQRKPLQMSHKKSYSRVSSSSNLCQDNEILLPSSSSNSPSKTAAKNIVKSNKKKDSSLNESKRNRNRNDDNLNTQNSNGDTNAEEINKRIRKKKTIFSPAIKISRLKKASIEENNPTDQRIITLISKQERKLCNYFASIITTAPCLKQIGLAATGLDVDRTQLLLSLTNKRVDRILQFQNVTLPSWNNNINNNTSNNKDSDVISNTENKEKQEFILDEFHSRADHGRLYGNSLIVLELNHMSEEEVITNKNKLVNITRKLRMTRVNI